MYSPEFVSAIQAALAVRPEQRPQSIQAFTQALRLLNGWAYQKDDRAWQRMPVWRGRFMGGLLTSALVWGSVPWFVLPTQDLAMVCLMMLVMLVLVLVRLDYCCRLPGCSSLPPSHSKA